MIAALTFDPSRGSVRRARFERRPHLPIDAACVVANGVREALRALLGEACSVTLGEPVAPDPAAWRRLSREALVFATPGRATDVVFVLTPRDARTLVRAAFGEDGSANDGSWSALESGAIERIVARCANTCEVLCVERRGPTRAVAAAGLPPCVAYFDVRVGAPIALTVGVGILRELPEPSPAATFSPAALLALTVEMRAILGRGEIPAPHLLELRPGDVLLLGTQVEGGGELNLAGQRIASGTCGVVGGRAAFEVRSTMTRGDAP